MNEDGVYVTEPLVTTEVLTPPTNVGIIMGSPVSVESDGYVETRHA